MKKVLFLSVIFLPLALVAQDAMVPVPEWLGWIVNWLLAVPAVGPYLVTLFQVAGAAVLILTAVAGSVQALGKLLEVSFKVVGAESKAESLKLLVDKVVYYLKYLSMFNAKK